MRHRSRPGSRLIPAALVLLAGLAAPALARQDDDGFAPPPGLASRDVAYPVDSGPVANPTDRAAVIWSANVVVPDATWLRLFFEQVDLAGDPTDGTGAYLLITSLLDGGVQRMDAVAIAQWERSTAYFNGEAVTIELVAQPNTGPSRVRLATAVAGQPEPTTRTLCGSTDDRTLSTDARSARLMPVGCSVWLINDTNHQFLTAGHCGPGGGGANVVQFNVPLSSGGGSPQNPPPDDQYYVEPTSPSVTSAGGIGADAAYFGCYPNPNTGLTPYQKQGASYILAAAAPGGSGRTIRVTGYGTTQSPVPASWNLAQKTHTGAYAGLSGSTIRYAVDTTGGNSGSPVLDEASGMAIGIHTHGGCSSSGGANSGTAIQWSTLQSYLNAPKGVCKTGVGTVAGPLYASTDLANNFGTANTLTGQFAKVSLAPMQIQGLAFDRNTDRFYAVDTARKLYRVDPDSGAFTLIGPVTGTTLTINGLGFDPGAGKLYGIAQSNGQLMTLDTATAAATLIGAPRGDTIGGLDYDAVNDVLYGLADLVGGTRLFRIDTATGTHTMVGLLGSGILDCNGLAWNDRDGLLYTINAANGRLLRVNPATGAATDVGPTGAIFSGTAGSTAVGAYGMAVRQLPPPSCTVDLNADGVVDFADYLAFLDLYDSADLAVDFTGDGLIDFADYLEFLTLYDTGC